MLSLPKLIFELAMSDLRALAAKDNDQTLKHRDIAVGRQLLIAALKTYRDTDDFDHETVNLISEIIILCLAFTTRHLEAVQTAQKSDPKHRLTNLDLAAMTLYQRAEKLQRLIATIEPPLEDDLEEDLEQHVPPRIAALSVGDDRSSASLSQSKPAPSVVEGGEETDRSPMPGGCQDSDPDTHTDHPPLATPTETHQLILAAIPPSPDPQRLEEFAAALVSDVSPETLFEQYPDFHELAAELLSNANPAGGSYKLLRQLFQPAA